MEFADEQEVINYIKKHLQVPGWITKARKNHEVLSALVLGKEFHKVLIKKIEKLESEDRAIARKKYSKDIRDMFDRVMQPRTSIFSAAGGSVRNEVASEQNKKKLIETLEQFKGQKSIKKYLSENFFRLEDTDPNGLIFLEYIDDVKIFPTYKSINDIRDYHSDGQLLGVLLFEPIEVHVGGATWQEWRVIDDKKDWRIRQRGSQWSLVEELTFGHPFGKVPGAILSDIKVTGSELRVSPLFPVEELSKDYARDKSILTIYKFQHGFPRHWRYESLCRECQGTGKDGTKRCKICDGKGNLRTNDVTDVSIIDTPREDDPIVTPNIEGFVSPDLETWKQYKDDLKDMEDLIESTMWGTRRLREGGNETATGRFIDVQPIMNKLGKFADNVEWFHNQLADWTENWVNGSPVEQSMYHITYGRRFIIESPDFILDKYNEAREKGANNTILDKLLDEYILSVYSNNPVLLEEMQKKRVVEPFVHLSISEINEIFGRKEADRKVLFVDFWEQADKQETVDKLQAEFKTFFDENATVIPPEPEPNTGEPTT